MNLPCTPRRAAAAAFLLLLAGCATTPPSAMQPGLWELTLTTSIEGRQIKAPPARQCITQKDIDDPTKTLPRPDAKCTLSNIDRSRDRATYDIVCKEETSTMQGRANLTIASDRYDGNVTMSVTQKGVQGAPLAVAINAKRIGECGK